MVKQYLLSHEKISVCYSSKQPISNGLTVKERMANSNFSEQYDFRIKILKEFGWKP